MSEGFPPLPEPYTPKQMKEFAAGLALVIDAFEAWSIRIADSGRLKEAQRVLARIGETGHVPSETEDERARTAHAISDALDFSDIRHALGEEKLRTTSRDLQQALKGRLDRGSPERRGYQFQSQLWVGAVLEIAGLNPTVVITGRDKTPDFRITPVTLPYAAEVKRPLSRGGILDELGKAAEQFSDFGHPGVLFLDFSECLDLPTGIMPASSLDKLRREHHEAALAINREVDQMYRNRSTGGVRSPKLSSILFCLLFSRSWIWTDEKQPWPFLASTFAAFGPIMHGTVVAWQRHNMLRSLIESFNRLGYPLTYENPNPTRL